jgi:hypothetical protein
MSKKHILNLPNILLVVGFSFQLIWILSLIVAKYVSQVEKGEVSLDFLLYYSAGHIFHYDSPTQFFPQLTCAPEHDPGRLPEDSEELPFPC